jgi:hypothetical protein
LGGCWVQGQEDRQLCVTLRFIILFILWHQWRLAVLFKGSFIGLRWQHAIPLSYGWLHGIFWLHGTSFSFEDIGLTRLHGMYAF